MRRRDHYRKKVELLAANEGMTMVRVGLKMFVARRGVNLGGQPRQREAVGAGKTFESCSSDGG